MLQDSELIDYEMIDIDYVFYGRTCVVPCIARLRSRRTPGRIVETRIRVLDVYVQEDGGRRQVASHMSLHLGTLAASQAVVALLQADDHV